MGNTAKLLIGGAIAIAAIGGGAGIAVATSGGPPTTDEVEEGTEAPIPRDALDEAKTAALDHAGGGRVVDSEVEAGRYEVEVVKDGRQVEIVLDKKFNVVDSHADDE